MKRSVKFFLYWSLAVAAAAQPAPDPEAARQLVEVARRVPGVQLEVRYATRNNFMQRVLYPQPRVFVRREVAEALERVQRRLDKHGLALLIFDGYRPWRITKRMWDETPEADRKFVANPAKGSKHNRGGAVDLSLWDVKRGRAVPMPSAYDEFSARAAYNYPGGTAQARASRDFLRRAMEAEGFQVLPHEWWHFDYKGWKSFPLLDYSFDELDRLQGEGKSTDSPSDFVQPAKNDWLPIGARKSLDPAEVARAECMVVRLDKPQAEDALLAAGMALAAGRPTALLVPSRKDLPWFLREADLSFPGQIFIGEGEQVELDRLQSLRPGRMSAEQRYDTFIGCLMSGLSETQYAEGWAHLQAINGTLAEKLDSPSNYCEGILVGSPASFGTPKESLVVDLKAVQGAERCVFYQYDDASRPSGMWVELGAALAWGKPSTLFTPSLEGVPQAIRNGFPHLKVVQYGNHPNMLRILADEPHRLQP